MTLVALVMTFIAGVACGIAGAVLYYYVVVAAENNHAFESQER
jgi:hypothetical protein